MIKCIINFPKRIYVMNEVKKKSRFYLTTILLLMVTVIAGRVVSALHTVTATDIAYADWVPSVFGWLGEIIPALRTAAGFCAIAAAVYYTERKYASGAVIITAAAAFLDYAARFFIDLLSSSLIGTELLAAVWLLLQFVYELIFIVLALLLCMMLKKKYDAAQTEIIRGKYSCAWAARWSVILVTISRILLEVYYFVDFVTSYSNITNTEIASIIGQFLKCLVIYGGIPLIFSEVLNPLYANILGHKEVQAG